MPRCAVLGVWSATRRKGTVHAVNARLTGYARPQTAKQGTQLVAVGASRRGATCVCLSTASTRTGGAYLRAHAAEMLRTDDLGALRALIIGARGDHARVTPHAPILPGSGDTASTRPGRRRTPGRRSPQAGEDRDTTSLTLVLRWCLPAACGRRASSAAVSVVLSLLVAALGSCTDRTSEHPDAPAPQTPSSSSPSSLPRGLNLPPAGTPTVHVTDYPLDTDVGPQTGAPGAR